jgi:hypothetical protein
MNETEQHTNHGNTRALHIIANERALGLSSSGTHSTFGKVRKDTLVEEMTSSCSPIGKGTSQASAQSSS